MKYTLKKAVENAFLCNKNNIIVEANNEFVNLSGYSKTELIGKSLKEISNILRIESQVNLENIKNEYTLYIFTKECEPREVTISCKRLQLEGETTYYVKERSKLSIESELPFVATLLLDNEIAIAVYSITGGILLKANDKFLDFFTSTCDDRGSAIGRRLEEIIAENEKSDFESFFFNVIENQKPYYTKEIKYESAERGDTYWNLSIVPICLSGKPKYIIHTASDITEKVTNRKLVEEQKEQLEAILENRLKAEENSLLEAQIDLLNNIIENIQVGFVRCSYPDFKIIDINNRANEDLKRINSKTETLEHIKGQNFFDIFNTVKEVEVTKGVQDLIGENSNFQNNYIDYMLLREGRSLKVIYQPLFGLNNKVIEIMIIAMDISEEVKAQNKMEEILKIQGEFFTNVAHELKTPLTVIDSTNQLMRLYFKGNSLDVNKEKISTGINVIKQNCYRLTRLINNLVDLSKIESGFIKLKLSNENIVLIIENIVQSISDYIRRRELNIIFDTNTEEKIIACEPDKIERIFLNLISNAIKFTNPGGSIFITLIDKDDFVEISVSDTGIGIEKENLDTIFERFHQVDRSLSRNTEGSGIGLTLVKSIIDMHGGNISVASEIGKGSTFKIELPAKIVENQNTNAKSNLLSSKIEMIKTEFSDIYSTQ